MRSRVVLVAGLVALALGCSVAAPTPAAPPAQPTPTHAAAVAPIPPAPTPLAARSPAVPTAAPPQSTAPTAAPVAPPPAATTPGPSIVRIRPAAGPIQEVRVELAATEAQRSRGLMERPSMSPDAGMLFIFPADSDRPFWMKDTLIPLSIAFIGADGRIVNIQDMQPQTTDLHAPGAAYRYALEVNQGFFARAGVKTGDTVELPPVPRGS